jgi:ATP/maltotriose-dependent transcriptional regulator MalT
MTNLFFAIFCFAVAAAIGLGFAVGVVVQNKSIRRFIVNLEQQLQAAVAALKAQAAANKASADAAIARVQATIDALKDAQAGGSVSDAVVTQAIADLNDATGTLSGVTAELDAEDQTPTPEADAAKA